MARVGTFEGPQLTAYGITPTDVHASDNSIVESKSAAAAELAVFKAQAKAQDIINASSRYDRTKVTKVSGAKPYQKGLIG